MKTLPFKKQVSTLLNFPCQYLDTVYTGAIFFGSDVKRIYIVYIEVKGSFCVLYRRNNQAVQFLVEADDYDTALKYSLSLHKTI